LMFVELYCDNVVVLMIFTKTLFKEKL